MTHPDTQPAIIEAEHFLQIHGDIGDGNVPVPEGTVFDGDGFLYFVSFHGEGEGSTIYKCDVDTREFHQIHADPAANFASVAFHPDGRLFAADIGKNRQAGAIIAMDRDGSDVETLVDGFHGDRIFPDDLVFDANGNLYFNDMTGTVNNPTGRILRLDADGTVTGIVDRLASPNGIAFSPDGEYLWASEHKANRLLKCTMTEDGRVEGKFPNAGIATMANLSGGEADSVTVDADGNVYVAMIRGGRTDVFDDFGHLLASIRPPGGRKRFPNTTHVAIRPGTTEGFMVAGGEEGAFLFSFPALAEGLPGLRER